MATDAQIIANRANALLSTGPVTAEGKENCKHNATKHGLSGAQIVVKGEDPAEYDRSRQDLFESYNPVGGAEEMLVERIAQSWWRLQRAERIEAAIVTALGGDVAIFTDEKASKKYANFTRHRGAIERAWKHAIKELDKLQTLRRKLAIAQLKAESMRSFAQSLPPRRDTAPYIGSELPKGNNNPVKKAG
jgi:hypothetical protein